MGTSKDKDSKAKATLKSLKPKQDVKGGVKGASAVKGGHNRQNFKP